MASANQYDAARTVCTPCRGSGQVISTLGGERHVVVCPWCGGSGHFIPGRDAQQVTGESAAPAP
jgi:DnaJ-class molecular chaperone